jgi:hypothetical protein
LRTAAAAGIKSSQIAGGPGVQNRDRKFMQEENNTVNKTGKFTQFTDTEEVDFPGSYKIPIFTA